MSERPYDPFDPTTWPKTNPGQNPPTDQNYNQPPNYNQPQNPPNYNQPQFPPGGFQQQFPPNYNPQFPPPPGGYQPFGNYQGGMQIDLPSSGTAQVCGIIGIVLFWNVIGIILNIVAIVNGSNGIREFSKYPGRYTEDSLRRARTGKTCGTIGLSLFGLVILIIIAAVAANS